MSLRGKPSLPGTVVKMSEVSEELRLVEAIVESKRTNPRMQGIGERGSRNQSVSGGYSFAPIFGGSR